jgi:simple sugar transport system ATP-binding protein
MAVEAISVRGDRGEQAIREVSFEVRNGEIFGIGGVDGNGQAELAEALVGLRLLASGRLSWNGGVFDPSVMPSTGYIPQDRRRHGLAATMSIEENLILDAVRERRYRYGPFLRRRALTDLASDLVRRYDIRIPGLRFPASSLSGGNQQKIVVARALRGEPDWIVAVNPTRGLDLAATRFVREQLLAARGRGAAVLVISTDLDELAAIADRAAILTAGKLTPVQLEGIAAGELGLALGGIALSAASNVDDHGVTK